jgi:hypothetical protein
MSQEILIVCPRCRESVGLESLQLVLETPVRVRLTCFWCITPSDHAIGHVAVDEGFERGRGSPRGQAALF